MAEEKQEFTLRIRFRVAPTSRLGIEDEECTYSAGAGGQVRLKSADGEGRAIKDAHWLVAKSDGWPTEEEALAAAEPLMDALRMAFGRFGIAIDVGNRAAKGMMFASGLRMLEEQTGTPFMNDEHGPMAYPSTSTAQVVRLGPAKAIKILQEDRWTPVLETALSSGNQLNEAARVASDLYFAACSAADNADARFTLLFAAIETLIPEIPHSDATVAHVDHLIELTTAADLPDEERRSLLGSLRWLRSYSIRAAGRLMIRDRLGGRMYGDTEAEDLFLNAYEMRNRLLHGGTPFPSRTEVDRLGSPLEVLVGHLIAGPLMDAPDVVPAGPEIEEKDTV